jgi:phosphatidylinositol alpha-mannosyltransferase
VRVALVAPYDLGVPGGVQGQVLGLARALAGTGDDVLVVAPGDPARWLGRPVDGVRLTGTGAVVSVPANGARAPIAASPLAGRRTLAALARFGPDVVHVHEPLVPGPAAAALRRSVAPVVATFHRAGAGAGYRLLGPVARPLVGRAAALVAVSEAARQTLCAVVGPSAERAEIVPNGVDLDRFDRARRRARRGPGLRVVFVGRLERRKGAEVLLAAVPLLRAATEPDPGLAVVVVGDGPLRPRLEAGAPARVTFRGRLDDEALADEVAAADAPRAQRLGDAHAALMQLHIGCEPVWEDHGRRLRTLRGGALENVDRRCRRRLSHRTPVSLRHLDRSPLG